MNKELKVVIEYAKGDRNPWFADVSITEPVTKELTDSLKGIRGVDAVGEGPSYNCRYEFYFTCGKAFDKKEVKEAIEHGIRKYFAS
jgi:hypothetical protein